MPPARATDSRELVFETLHVREHTELAAMELHAHGAVGSLRWAQVNAGGAAVSEMLVAVPGRDGDVEARKATEGAQKGQVRRLTREDEERRQVER